MSALTDTTRRYFRVDAALALPNLYEFLEDENYRYAIRLKGRFFSKKRLLASMNCYKNKYEAGGQRKRGGAK
jgi:hypothetical protein